MTPDPREPQKQTPMPQPGRGDDYPRPSKENVESRRAYPEFDE